MIKKHDNQAQINILNNYNNENNKKNDYSNKTKKVFKINDIINKKIYSKINSESEKSAIMEIYTETISTIFNHHFNN